MAFQDNIKINDNQIEIQSAYIKVTAVQVVSKGQENICYVNYSAYKDKASADSNLKPLDNYSDSFNPIFGEGVADIKAQAYDAAKAKSLFPQAIDC